MWISTAERAGARSKTTWCTKSWTLLKSSGVSGLVAAIGRSLWCGHLSLRSIRGGACKGPCGRRRPALGVPQAFCKDACKTVHMDGSLELRVLGSIEVERGGAPAAIGGPKPRLVLA